MRKKPPDISQEDWDELDIPEWTEEDFARARRFREVFPEQFAAWEKKRLGRPPAVPASREAQVLTEVRG